MSSKNKTFFYHAAIIPAVANQHEVSTVKEVDKNDSLD
jgi:hypothetical protein